MNNKATLSDHTLVIEPRGLDKLWSFTTSIEIPWNHVRGATHDPGMKKEPKGWRGPGLRVGTKLSGTFHNDHEKQFWNVNGYENTVVIELTNEKYSRLVVSLDDPAETAARITERATGQ